MKNPKDVPTTWEYNLNEHWIAFSALAWKGFSIFEEETRKIGHENKVDKFKWREYLIWDMQRRNDEEMSHYSPNQTCRFCENPESILTKETCCTGCSKL